MQYVIKWESKVESGYTNKVFDNYNLAYITAEKLNRQSFVLTHTVVELTEEIDNVTR